MTLTIRLHHLVALPLVLLGAFALLAGPLLQRPCRLDALRLDVAVGGNTVVVLRNEVVAAPGQAVEISAVVVTAPQQCGGAFSFDWRQLLGSNPSEVESRSLSPTEGMLRFVAGNRIGENVITLTVRDGAGVVQGRRSLLVRVEGD